MRAGKLKAARAAAIWMRVARSERSNMTAKPRLVRTALAGVGALAAALAAPAVAQEGLKSDFLEILPTKDLIQVWNDKGTRAKKSISVAWPKVPAGWYNLGHVARTGYGLADGKETAYTLLVKPRPGHESVLRRPDGYNLVWTNKGSGKGRSVWFYMPVCPKGYVAMGGVATTVERGFDNSFRCIDNWQVEDAAWDGAIYDDSGTGLKQSLTVWRSTYKGGSKNDYFAMSPGVMWPVDGYREPRVTALALRIRFGELKNPAAKMSDGRLKRPVLNGPGTWEKQAQEELPTEDYEVPFYQVKDPFYPAQLDQWINSPNYKVVRKLSYEKSKNDMDLTSCGTAERSPASLSYTEGTGWEESTGSTWTAGGSVTVTGTGGVKPLGVGFDLSVAIEANFSHSWESGKSKSGSTEVERGWTVEPGTYGAVFFRTSSYEVFRKDGSRVSVATFVEKQPEFLTWAPHGWTADAPCRTLTGRLLEAGERLESGQEYWPGRKRDGGYYMVFDKGGDGDLTVRSDTGGVFFSLKAKGYSTDRADRMEFTPGGSLVLSKGDSALPSSEIFWKGYDGPSLPRGAMLTMTRDGVLQIVSVDGQVRWSSDKVPEAIKYKRFAPQPPEVPVRRLRGMVDDRD